MDGEEKQQEGQGEKTIVLGAEDCRRAKYFGANHLQTTLLPSAHCTLIQALFHGPSRDARPTLALVSQHFLQHAAWLPTPENPPYGSRLSCPAQAVLASTLFEGYLQVQHILPGSPIGFSRQILWPLGNTGVPSPWS